MIHNSMGQMFTPDGYNMGYNTVAWNGGLLNNSPMQYQAPYQNLYTYTSPTFPQFEKPLVNYWDSQSIYDYKMKTTY